MVDVATHSKASSNLCKKEKQVVFSHEKNRVSDSCLYLLFNLLSRFGYARSSSGSNCQGYKGFYVG